MTQIGNGPRIEDPRQAAEAARRAALAARPTTASPTPTAPELAGDRQGLGAGATLEGQDGPTGAAAMPARPTGARESDYEGFEGFGNESAPEAEAEAPYPERFDAAGRARFIGAELDRLGLQGADRTRKEARLQTLFRGADRDGDGTLGAPGERESLVRGLLAESQADAITQQIRAGAAAQAQALTDAAAKAKGGHAVARGFNSFLNVFNGNMDQMDQARDNAVRLLRSDLPRDLERFNDMVAAAAGDPTKLTAAQDYLKGALAKSEVAGREFDKRMGDFKSSNKFWSGLAADVGSGLLVLGGVALTLTGVGAPIGAGMIAAGFVAGGTASVGLHYALDSQYDIYKEGVGNFLVGGISAAATVATAGLAAGATSGLAGTLGKAASNQAVTAGLTGFAQEGANGFQEGWLGRVAVGTATGAVLGKVAGAAAQGVAGKLAPSVGSSFVAQKLVAGVSGATAGAIGSGGGALVNEALGGFQEGAQDRILQQTLGGALAGGATAMGPDLAAAARKGQARTLEARQAKEMARLAELDIAAAQGDAQLAGALKEVTSSAPYQERVADAKAKLAKALGHSPDTEAGFYTSRVDHDVNHGVDPALVKHIDEGAKVVSRDVPDDVARPKGKIAELKDFRAHEETFERLLDRDPAALKAVYSSAYEAVGINPAAVEKLVHDYTHSSNSTNKETFQALSDSAQHIAKGGAPRAPERLPDGTVREFKYDVLLKAMQDTRPARAQFLADVTGLPPADAYRVYRGTGNEKTVNRIATSWFEGDKSITISNHGLTSTSLDPRAGVDFGIEGPRSKTVEADKSVRPLSEAKAGAYVTYDLDVQSQHVVFDKYTDGGFSVDGAILQRSQREVLMAHPDKQILTDVRRSTITFEGQIYTYEQRDALRQAMQQQGHDWTKR